MAMLDVVVATLQGDATLMALLTGGLYDGQTVSEISRQMTPAAFDAWQEVQPCAIVKAESATPWGPLHHSGRVYFVVWLYQRGGSGVIEQARNRIYALLHRQQLSTTAGIFEIAHANDILGIDEEALSAQGQASRFVATVRRTASIQ